MVGRLPRGTISSIGERQRWRCAICQERIRSGYHVDHIVPLAHGRHVVDRLPDASLTVIDGESHLGGLGIAEEVIDTLLDLGPHRAGNRRTARK